MEHPCPFRTQTHFLLAQAAKSSSRIHRGFIEDSSLPALIRQHSNQRGKEVTRYAKLEQKHFVGGYEALAYSVMPGATERKVHEHSFPYEGG